MGTGRAVESDVVGEVDEAVAEVAGDGVLDVDDRFRKVTSGASVKKQVFC